MNSNPYEPAAKTAGPPALSLEIPGQEDNTSRLIPVVIRNLSTEGVTLAVKDPGDPLDWDWYRSETCVLHVADPEGGEPVDISAQITWIRSGAPGQPPLSLGLHLMKPPAEAISRLSNLLPHTSQDIKGLWDRYDQVRNSPENHDWVHHGYMIGLSLLLAGLALQVAGPQAYKGWGWVLWLLGSVGIAGKVIRPFWPKQPVPDRTGRTL